jgi:hypothetical protein
MATGELMRVRTAVSAVCTEMISVAHRALAFPGRMGAARFEIARASRELEAVIRVLRLPAEIRLSLAADEPAETERA